MRITIAIVAACQLLVASASAQRVSNSEIVSRAVRAAGYSECSDFDQRMGTPDVFPPPMHSYRMCYRGDTRQVWRVSPTPAGLGINEERMAYVDYRLEFESHLMWISPNRPYVPHDMYFSGRTNRSGSQFEPLNRATLWSEDGITLPFIPRGVVYFGDRSGVANVGLTGLSPIDGLQNQMYPLRPDSVIIAINGARFGTTQSYINLFNTRPGTGRQYIHWRSSPEYFEVAYYTSRDMTDDVASMRRAARVAYIPVYPVRAHLQGWRALTDTPSARALSLGVTGDIGQRLLGPIAAFSGVMDAIGWDEEAYQRRRRACAEVYGICG